METALAEKLARQAPTRLAEDCAKLDPAEERQLANEALGADVAQGSRDLTPQSTRM